jgi:acyl carrier protein
MTTPTLPIATSTRRTLHDAVVRALRRVNPRLERDIDENDSVVDDLGFDSLKMVELAFALEDELGVTEFPLQLWWDAQQTGTESGRFTVGSLVLHAATRTSFASGAGGEK